MKRHGKNLLTCIAVLLAVTVSALTVFSSCTPTGDDSSSSFGGANEYTVTFDTEGGSEIESVTVTENDYAERPDNPVREGHIFKGWYLDLNNTEDGSFAFDETPITGDITLHALWQIRTFKVRYVNDNDEELEGFPSGVYNWGTVLESPDTAALEKDGFKIKWYKDNGEIWDFATSKVVSNVNLKYNYVTDRDSFNAEQIAATFYPTADRNVTVPPEECWTVYSEGDETVKFVYTQAKLMEIVLNCELDPVNYDSVTVVCRTADKEGNYTPEGMFSQVRAYVKTDLGGHIAWNDEGASGYSPKHYYIGSTGVNANLVKATDDGEWTTYTFDLSGLKYWHEGARCDAFAFGFVSTTMGIEVKSLVFNKVDKDAVYSVKFRDGANNEIASAPDQQVKWNTSAVKPETLADEENRKYTGEWLTAEGKVFDFESKIRKDVVLYPQYTIEGKYSWTGEDLMKDFYPVFNNDRTNPAGKKLLENGSVVFYYNNGTSSTGLEQITVNNLNLSTAGYNYLTVKFRTVDYKAHGYNSADNLNRARIYLLTNLGGDLIVKDVEDKNSYYWELNPVLYNQTQERLDITGKLEDGWQTATIDLSQFPYYTEGSMLYGFAFGLTQGVPALEIAEITISETIEEKLPVTVSFLGENGEAIEGLEPIEVPYGKTVTAPSYEAVPVKEGYDFDKWLDENGAEFNFGLGLTENTVLHAAYVKAGVWEDVSYTGQDIADHFTASRERYGNTIGTAPNCQYPITLTDGEATFTYTTDMKPANKCITVLDLALRIHSGSKVSFSFVSEAVNSGSYGYRQLKIGLAFRGEDPATTILNGASNAHYYNFNPLKGTEDKALGMSYVTENGVTTVTCDLFQMAQSATGIAAGVDINYIEAFTFMVVESAMTDTATPTSNEDTIIWKSVDFVSVEHTKKVKPEQPVDPEPSLENPVDITYAGQELVDNFTASRERYGDTIGTGANVQFPLTLSGGEAVFTYVEAMKAANKCINGINLGMHIQKGSQLVITFASEALTAGTHAFRDLKIGVAFKGEDPAEIIYSKGAQHYFEYRTVADGKHLYGGTDANGIISFVIENNVVVVTFDLYKMAEASKAAVAEGVDVYCIDAFTFLVVESTPENPTGAEVNVDTITWKSVEFTGVEQEEKPVELVTVTHGSAELAASYKAAVNYYGKVKDSALYALTAEEEGASFNYAAELAPTNRHFIGLNLGIKITEGSKMVLKFKSELLASGEYCASQVKMLMAFKGEDLKATLTNANKVNLHNYSVNATEIANEGKGSCFTYTIDESGIVTVIYDLYAIAQDASANVTAGADAYCLDGFDFAFVAADKAGGVKSYSKAGETITFLSVEYVDVAA